MRWGILACLLLLAFSVFAESYVVKTSNDGTTIITEEFDVGVSDDFEGWDSLDKMEDPFMGVVAGELTLSDAAELGYYNFYGVRILQIVPNSAAKYYRLLVDDIIMEIDSVKIKDMKVFYNVIDSHYPGDKVKIKIFSNENEKDVDFVFGKRGIEFGEIADLKKKDQLQKISEVEMFEQRIVKRDKNHHSVGYGGGTWIPVIFQPEIDDVNYLIDTFGFTKLDDVIFLNGGGGMGNVGKGYFIGGMGAGYGLERTEGNKKMDFSVGFGGVTLDKRFAISKNIIPSLGFMLGWGGYNLEVTNTTGNYDWNSIDSLLTNQIEGEYSNQIKISRSYILLQPRVTVLYRILDWLALRGEIGYMYAYSYHNGWHAENLDTDIQIDNSPDTPFDGLTFSVGPWFGF